MTIQGAIYLAIVALAVLPIARFFARDIGARPGDPADVLQALALGILGSFFWPLIVGGMLVWWLVNRAIVARVVVPESADAKIRRLEERNAQLEHELGLNRSEEVTSA